MKKFDNEKIVFLILCYYIADTLDICMKKFDNEKIVFDKIEAI